MSSAFDMSATKGITSWPLRAAMSLAACSTSSRERAQMATRQPSAERASAEPRPSPLDAAVTRAILPLMPRSMAPPGSAPAHSPVDASDSAGRGLRALRHAS